MSSFATNTICEHSTLCPRELIEDTVRVMNHALHQPSPRGAAQEGAQALARDISDGKVLRISIVSGDDPTIEKASVAIRYDDSQVELLPGDTAVSADTTFKICEDHLADVSANPQRYIDAPMKLELVWLKERTTQVRA